MKRAECRRHRTAVFHSSRGSRARIPRPRSGRCNSRGSRAGECNEPPRATRGTTRPRRADRGAVALGFRSSTSANLDRTLTLPASGHVPKETRVDRGPHRACRHRSLRPLRGRCAVAGGSTGRALARYAREQATHGYFLRPLRNPARFRLSPEGDARPLPNPKRRRFASTVERQLTKARRSSQSATRSSRDELPSPSVRWTSRGPWTRTAASPSGRQDEPRRPSIASRACFDGAAAPQQPSRDCRDSGRGPSGDNVSRTEGTHPRRECRDPPSPRRVPQGGRAMIRVRS